MKLNVNIGDKCITEVIPPLLQRKDDIQSLDYEFGFDVTGCGAVITGRGPEIVCVEIWRGAVVRVDPTGAITFVGNEAGAKTPHEIEALPISKWERAPSLIDNPHYVPKKATGAGFVEPLDRTVIIPGNAVQTRTGSVQMEGRVNTVTPYRYRAR